MRRKVYIIPYQEGILVVAIVSGLPEIFTNNHNVVLKIIFIFITQKASDPAFDVFTTE